MNYDWRRAVREARSSGAGSSGSLSGFRNIKFWRDGNRWMYRDQARQVTEINDWGDIPVNTIHFKPIGEGNYAKLNSHDETVVDELTKSIMRGDVKIIGAHSCVNFLGAPPVSGCKEIDATVPVPIRIRGDAVYAKLDYVKVRRGSNYWYMYKANIEESTSSGGNRTEMEENRIYMCGGL